MIEKNLEIVFNKKIAARIFLMGLMSPEIARESIPGQFVMIRVGSGLDPLLRRPFSICGTRQGQIVCLLYKVVGRGTAMLAGSGEGESLPVMGPLGKGFEIDGGNKKHLLIGGGMGIAPLIFLVQAMKAHDVEFMAGFGSSDEVVDIQEVGQSPINLSLATDDGTKGTSGTVTDLLGNYLDRDEGKAGPLSLYACGPAPMLKRVSFMAIDRNLPCQVSLESVMACGLGACQGCAVKSSRGQGLTSYQHVCTNGPVFPAESMDWEGL